MLENNTHNSSERFKNYFSDKMSNDDKLRFENDLLENQFEKEAFEGFQSLENNAEALELIKEIETQIERKTGAKRDKTISFPLWKSLSIAASLLLIIGVGILMSQFLKNDSSSNLSENTIEIPQEELSVTENVFLADTLAENEMEIEIDEMEETDQTLSDEKNKTEIKKEEKTILPTPISETKEREDKTQFADSESEFYAEDVQEPQVSMGKKETSQSVVNMIENDIATEEINEAAAASSSYEIANSLYKGGQFSAAKNYFKKSVTEGKEVQASNYYEAMCEYQLGNNKSAKNKFDLIINSQSSFSNISKWYKADILLKESKTSEAKTLLQELANGSSSFKKQAEDKLKELN